VSDKASDAKEYTQEVVSEVTDFAVEILEETEVTKSFLDYFRSPKAAKKNTAPASQNHAPASSLKHPQPKREPGKPGVFPVGDPKVYHFHPIAFVEQMRKLGNSTCECNQFNLIWGSKVSCEFRKKVVKIASNLGLPQENYEGANWLMAVMALETGRTFDPSITNDLGYTGLIQFGKPAAIDLKSSTAELRKMDSLAQLDYVENYFLKYKSKLKTITDLYLSVLFPSAAGNGSNPNYVVFDDDASGLKKKAYKANPSFFQEEDEITRNKKGAIVSKDGKSGGKTYVWEIEKEIRSFYDSGLQFISKSFECSFSKEISNLQWHDPVIDPQIALYNYYGELKPLGSHFGTVRNDGKKNHQGLDIFAPLGTLIYSCLDGEVVETNNQSGNFGRLIVIKVKTEDLLKSPNNYKLQFGSQGEKYTAMAMVMAVTGTCDMHI
jgi:murein DD-endopeptidase MepM/ murein hydrolase activator NlpD